MKKNRPLVFAILVCAGSCLVAVAGTPQITVIELPDLAVEGTTPAQGVAGAFSSFSERGKVFVAGGCNFPEKGPADGGKKVFYDTIWELQLGIPDAKWMISEHKLPEPIAYGASCFCWLGGENSQKKLSIVFSPFGGVNDSKTSLPVAMDNAAASETTIAGGNVNGVPANKAFSFCKTSEGNSVNFEWKELPDFPGSPRAQPVCGFVKTPRGRAFALIGGFSFDKEKSTAIVDCAGVIYYPKEKKWEHIPALPPDVSKAGLVGSAAMEYEGGLLIVGGVNAEIFKNALEKPEADYLRHEPEWYKFNADVIFLSFDKDGNAVWEKFGSVPELARAGAALTPIGKGDFIYVCGELKPGFRSTKCVHVKIEK